MNIDRDTEKAFARVEFIAELRRLADALESGEAFEIEIDGEQVVVPEGAVFSVEHEREEGRDELEFQLSWGKEEEEDEEGDDDEDADAEDHGNGDSVPA
ncbi:hypothetical protein STVA_14760 [Allostella vacuolata]|nr:hypothetical protein STVA_14760 [Stella vacuolata]